MSTIQRVAPPGTRKIIISSDLFHGKVPEHIDRGVNPWSFWASGMPFKAKQLKFGFAAPLTDEFRDSSTFALYAAQLERLERGEIDEIGRLDVGDLILDELWELYPPELKAMYEAAGVPQDAWHYSGGAGVPYFRNEYAAAMKRLYGLNINPDHVIPTAGGSNAIEIAAVVVAAGGAVAYLAPGYMNNAALLRPYGIEAIPILTTRKFKMPNKRELLAFFKAHPEVKAIIVASPNNPVGNYYTYRELCRLWEAAAECGVIVLVDSVYGAYVGQNYPHLMKLDRFVSEWVIDCGSFSKILTTSLRIGAIICTRADIRRKMFLWAQAKMGLVSVPDQYKVADLMRTQGLDRAIPRYREAFKARAKIAREILGKVPGVEFVNGEDGGLYLFIRIRGLSGDTLGEYLSKHFVHEVGGLRVGLTLTPGSHCIHDVPEIQEVYLKKRPELREYCRLSLVSTKKPEHFVNNIKGIAEAIPLCREIYNMPVPQN